MPKRFGELARCAAIGISRLGIKDKHVAVVENSLISEGCRIYGTVINSVLSGGVLIEKDAIVKDSVIMEDVTVKSGASVYSSIVDSDVIVESGAVAGVENADKNNILIYAKGTVITADTSAKN